MPPPCCVDITIGFSQRKYVFSESARFATIDVEITSGTPSVPVIVVLELFFTDARAVRKFTSFFSHLTNSYIYLFIKTQSATTTANLLLGLLEPLTLLQED